MQEIIELVVFGLIALLLGTGLLWVLGWLMGLAGIVFKFAAGFLWSLLRFIVPIVIIGGVAYALVRFFQNQSSRPPATTAPPTAPVPAPAPAAAAPAADTSDDGDGGAEGDGAVHDADHGEGDSHDDAADGEGDTEVGTGDDTAEGTDDDERDKA